MSTVLTWSYIAAVAGIVFMGWACWHRAHDGTMTGRAELTEDIAEDTSSLPE